MIVGAVSYPSPVVPELKSIDSIVPDNLAVASAPVPSPPLNDIVGGKLYPEPVTGTLIVELIGNPNVADAVAPVPPPEVIDTVGT